MANKIVKTKKTVKKTVTPKKVAKTTKTVVVKKTPAKTEAKKETVAHEVTGLSATVVDLAGKAKGKVTLPGALFEAKVNKELMAQAVRVYLANQREGSASTKTRGEVEGSTRKIYKQKGTGRARHGSVRAPIFVHGGITFGPRPHDFRLQLPEQMRHAALASALTSQYKSGNTIFMDGLSEMEPKTKIVHRALLAVGSTGSTLLVVTSQAKNVVRAARNLDNVHIVSALALNTHDTLMYQKIVFMKEAIRELSDKAKA